ncbi:aminotransferase class IV [Paenibacillus agilis]|uniref:4-amino-4-deoxychorismate lyase n=1 Tax=Paenibacillus agilis TaxID=3020863 RepID=A0A559IC00_9BACL|nr:aminotransferase class IV [Paenibacillus agilis]TVX85175.1 4-amino-4-deoxychorismate lyase [Paenibacillus agilis]
MVTIGWNGELKSTDEAMISVADHGFLYGMTLFETIRTYGGKPFLWERHLERLCSACDEVGILLQLDEKKLRQHIREVMEANQLPEAYIRLTISAGEHGEGLPIGDYTNPQVIVFARPLPQLPESLYETGKPLQLLSTRRSSPETAIRVKSGHYMNNIIAKRELSKYPSAQQGAEGLMLNTACNIAEGIVSNVFWIKAGQLYTPAIETGILPGITRAAVLALVEQQGVRYEEGAYTWSHLLEADEVFLTTSIQELVPVTLLCDTEQQRYVVGDGRIGRLTKKLLEQYRQMATSG